MSKYAADIFIQRPGHVGGTTLHFQYDHPKVIGDKIFRTKDEQEQAFVIGLASTLAVRELHHQLQMSTPTVSSFLLPKTKTKKAKKMDCKIHVHVYNNKGVLLTEKKIEV